MLSANARGPIGRFMAPVGRTLAKTPLTPNALTVAGGAGAIGGSVVIAQGHLFVGCLVTTVFVLLDLVDGTLARARGLTSPWGAFLDSTMDRVSDGAIFSGVVFWYAGRGGEPWIAGVALFCLVSGVVVSYIKARAEGLGFTCNVGFAERAERLIILLVGVGLEGLGLPFAMAVALWVLALASVVTVVQRLVVVHRQIVAT